MEIIKNFGLNPILFGAQILNFLIVLYLLKKILYKPIFNHLKNREEKIRNGLENAKASQELLERTTKKEKDILIKTQNLANKIIADANNKSREIIAKAHAQSKKQSELMIQEAREQIKEDTISAEKKLSAYVTKVSIDILEKALSKMVNEETQKSVLSQVLKEIN